MEGDGVGSVDYATGELSLTLNKLPDVGSYILFEYVAEYDGYDTNSIVFRSPVNPIKAEGVYIKNSSVNDTSLSDGTFAGDFSGQAYDDSGLVIASTSTAESALNYSLNVTALSVSVINSDLIGINAERLPENGKVPVFHVGQTVNLGRGDLAEITLYDASGNEVSKAADIYSEDRATGSITFANPLDLTGYTEPLTAEHRIEDRVVIVNIQSDGTLELNAPLQHDYTNTDSLASAILHQGDLKARVSLLFDQETWTGIFSDSLIGDVVPAEYNDVQYPISVANESAVDDRWAVVFTSSSSFECYSETRGLIGYGSTLSDFSPMNAQNGLPFFTIYADGWGSGWSAGNVMRFNTKAGNAPVWAIRVVRPGFSAVDSDGAKIQIRGGAN